MQATGGDGWACSCGARNSTGAAACFRCGLDRPFVMAGALSATSPGPASTSPAGVAGSAFAQLVGVSPGLRTLSFNLDPNRALSIGREPSNDVALELESSVSARHARIYRAGGYYALEDLESTNGTFVNGQRVTGHQVLMSGDVVQLGEAQLRFVAAAPAAGPRPAPPATSRPAAPVSPSAPPVHASQPVAPFTAEYPAPPAPQPGNPSSGYAPAPYGPPGHLSHGYPPPINPQQPYYQQYPASTGKDKVTAGLLGILLGSFGIHLFYLNQIGWGITYLLITILTCGLGAAITHLLGLIQGILYLCANDADFQRKYVNERQFF